MKKILVAFIVVLLTASFAQSAPLPFDVLDTTYAIDSRAGDDSGSAVFNETSDSPLEALIEYTGPEATVTVESIARAGYLSSKFNDNDSTVNVSTDVWSETVFQPTFNGSGPLLTFFHTVEYPYGNNEIIVTDNTLGIDIYNPGWDIEPDPRLLAFDYDSWDMAHIYTLRMALWGSTNAVGFENYEMGTNFPSHASVPEPGTISALVLGIIGLMGFRWKMMHG